LYIWELLEKFGSRNDELFKKQMDKMGKHPGARGAFQVFTGCGLQPDVSKLYAVSVVSSVFTHDTGNHFNDGAFLPDQAEA
jgi:hypothetical protein